MVTHKQAIILLVFLFILTMGMLAYFVHTDGVENQIENKPKAVEALKTAAELWVNREVDEMHIPYSSTGGKEDKKKTRRSVRTAKDTIVVTIDSLKEHMRLSLSGEMGPKVIILYLLDDFSLETCYSYWLDNMENLKGYRCALQADVNGFEHEDKPRHFIGGDSTLCVPANLLGTYYLDDLYVIEVKAYLQPPAAWKSAEWSSPEILTTLIIGVLMGIGLILYITYTYRKKPDSRPKILQEKYIYQLSGDTYRIGDIEYNDKTGLITCGDKSSFCPPQPHRLLSAFLFAPEHFLSNKEIAEICGWALDDTGIDTRRRSTIKSLRKQLFTEETGIRIDAVKGKNGYQLFVIEIE